MINLRTGFAICLGAVVASFYSCDKCRDIDCHFVDAGQVYSFYNLDGASLLDLSASEGGVKLLSIQSLEDPDFSIEWELGDSYGGEGFGDGDQFFVYRLSDVWATTDGSPHRHLIVYERFDETFVDTLTVHPYTVKRECCSSHFIGELLYDGPKVAKAETRDLFPGLDIYLED